MEEKLIKNRNKDKNKEKKNKVLLLERKK